jgi:hypothetical protein
MSIRQFAAGFVIAAVAIATPAVAQQDLTGNWTGGYVAAAGSDANTFEMKLKSAGATFTGTATEVNTFGDVQKALFLTSMIQGTIKADGSVSFVKTYDGSGGVGHSVSYNGKLDATGRRIRGKFQADGADGVFEMVR